MITSSQNSHIKELKKLTNLRAYRAKTRRYVCEHMKGILNVLTCAPHLVERVFVSISCNESVGDLLREVLGPWQDRIPVTVCADAVLNGCSRLKSPQGMMAVFRQEESKGGMSGHVVLLDGIQHPDNMGAIIRNCVGFGVSTIVVTPSTVDPYHPVSVHAASGIVYPVVFVACSDAVVKELADHCWLYLSSDPASGLKLMPEVSLSQLGRGPFVLVLGSEGRGICDPALLNYSQKQYVTIPINPVLESLNVAVVSGIVLSRL